MGSIPLDAPLKSTTIYYHMKLLLLGFIVFIIVATACTHEKANVTRVKQLMSETGAIAQDTRDEMRSQDIMGKIQQLNEAKLDFPDNRDEIIRLAEPVKTFFTKSVADNDLIVSKYREILDLGVDETFANCIRLNIALEQNQTEQLRSVIAETDLVFDESIKDRATFESRSRDIREGISPIKKRNEEIDIALKSACLNSM